MASTGFLGYGLRDENELSESKPILSESRQSGAALDDRESQGNWFPA